LVELELHKLSKKFEKLFGPKTLKHSRIGKSVVKVCPDLSSSTFLVKVSTFCFLISQIKIEIKKILKNLFFFTLEQENQN